MINPDNNFLDSNKLAENNSNSRFLHRFELDSKLVNPRKINLVRLWGEEFEYKNGRICAVKLAFESINSKR